MRNIGIIGCGGINSWFCKNLKETIDIFYNNKDILVSVYDDDIVEEKNILANNQNFIPSDVMDNKVDAISKKYGFIPNPIIITEENINVLSKHDDIIIGVDNHKTRRLLYKYCLENKKYLLDMRAQGTQVAFYILDHSKTIDYYDKLMFNNKDIMEKKGSCQLAIDIETGHIENGNKIIATIGCYGIYLKRLRGETPSTNEFNWVY